MKDIFKRDSYGIRQRTPAGIPRNKLQKMNVPRQLHPAAFRSSGNTANLQFEVIPIGSRIQGHI